MDSTHQEPVARPPSAPASSLQLHPRGVPGISGISFSSCWRPGIPRLLASLPTPSSCIGLLFRDTVRKSHGFGQAHTVSDCLHPLSSSHAHPNSPHLVSSSTRLPCARGFPSPSPAAPGPDTCVTHRGVYFGSLHAAAATYVAHAVHCTYCTHCTSVITFLTHPHPVLFVPTQEPALHLLPGATAFRHHTQCLVCHVPCALPTPAAPRPSHAMPCMSLVRREPRYCHAR